MIVTGGRGTYAQFASQVAKDFTGPPGQNFTYFIVGIGAVGAVGYFEPLKTISRLFMVLIIIVIFLSNKGFFQQFQNALKSGPTAPQAPSQSASVGVSSIGSGAAAAPSAVGAGAANAPSAVGAGAANWFTSLFGK